jgi:hypothetical protein
MTPPSNKWPIVVGFFAGIGSFVVTRDLMPSFSWWVLALVQVTVQVFVGGLLIVFLEWEKTRKEFRAAAVKKELAAIRAAPPPPPPPRPPANSAEAHVWIAVFASEFVRTRTAFGGVVAAEVALSDLRERPELLKKLGDALRHGSDIP